MSPRTTQTYYALLNPPGYPREHYVGLDVTRPNGTERLRFSGTDRKSPWVAAKKAFSEYLEALTLWQLGATEEESRSGWACGRTATEAADNAYRELIERDALITHFLCPNLKTWVLHAPDRQGLFKLARAQSIDANLVVIFCGYYLEDSRRWLLGGACDANEDIAIHKALLEVVMMRKDWHGLPPDIELDQPKRTAFWSHWKNQTHPKVQRNIENIFSGGGTTSSSFQIDATRTVQKFERRFSPSHVVIGCEHPDIIPLTFGSLWAKSETRVRELFKKRGLDLDEWLIHPML